MSSSSSTFSFSTFSVRHLVGFVLCFIALGLVVILFTSSSFSPTSSASEGQRHNEEILRDFRGVFSPPPNSSSLPTAPPPPPPPQPSDATTTTSSTKQQQQQSKVVIIPPPNFHETDDEKIMRRNEQVCSSIPDHEDTVIVTSAHFAHGHFIRLQYLGLKEFLSRSEENIINRNAKANLDWFHFVVIDDSLDPAASRNIRDEAARLGVHYLRVPPSWHSPAFVVARDWTKYMPTWDKAGGIIRGAASGRASVATQFAYDNLVLRRHHVDLAKKASLPVRRNGIYFYLDSDVLPFDSLNLRVLFKGNQWERRNGGQKEIVLIPQTPYPGVRYPWMALFAADLAKIRERFPSSHSSSSQEYDSMMKDLVWCLGHYVNPTNNQSYFLDAGGQSAAWIHTYKPTESSFHFDHLHWFQRKERSKLYLETLLPTYVRSLLLLRVFYVDFLVASGYPEVTTNSDPSEKERACFYHYRSASGWQTSQKLLHARRLRVLSDMYLQVILSPSQFVAEQKYILDEDRKQFGSNRTVMIDLEVGDGSFLRKYFEKWRNSNKTSERERWDVWGFEKRGDLSDSVGRVQEHLFELFTNQSVKISSMISDEKQRFRLFLFPNASLNFPPSSSSSSLLDGFPVSLPDAVGVGGTVGIDVRSVFRHIAKADNVIFHCPSAESQAEVESSLKQLNLADLVDSFIQ